MNKRSKAIYEVAADIVLGKVPSDAEIIDRENRFQKVWDDSGQTDFSFYDDPDYMYLALNSWRVQSAGDIEHCIKRELFSPLPKYATVFDFCGGIGMTACLLATEYPLWNVITHNIAPKQRDAARDLVKRLDLPNVVVTDQLEGKADLTIAQETFEHFKEPFDEVADLLDETKPLQYLDATHFGFASPGHFDVFLDGTTPVPRKKAKRLFNKVLRGLGYEQFWKRRNVKAPFNGHPSLWEL